MQKINNYLSQKISFISMVSMLAVVFVHAYNYTDTFLQPGTIITEGLHPGACIQFAISNALTRYAVPFFFMISGFLFFKDKEFGVATYGKQVKKRCRSVLSVFLIFSVLSFAVCYLVYRYTGSGIIPMIDERIDKSWYHYILQNPFAFQLWFLAQLFVMCIVSPIVYFLVKKLKVVALVPLAVLWFMDKGLSYGGFTIFNCDAYMFFTLGAYVAVNKVNIKGLYQKTENKGMWIVSAIVWLSLTGVYTYICATAKESTYIQVLLFKLIELAGISFIWFSYDRLSQKFFENSLTQTLVKNNFMVYLLHEPLMHIIFMWIVTYHTSDLVHALLYFPLPVAIILVCAYIGKFLRNKCPCLNSILIGGR